MATGSSIEAACGAGKVWTGVPCPSCTIAQRPAPTDLGPAEAACQDNAQRGFAANWRPYAVMRCGLDVAYCDALLSLSHAVQPPPCRRLSYYVQPVPGTESQHDSLCRSDSRSDSRSDNGDSHGCG